VLEFFEQVWRSLIADWRPAAEIAILAVVIYLVFRFLRGTRGAAVLRGAFFAILAALAALFLVAEALELARVVWVVERLAALTAIGVLVVFQPEIRRGLMRLGGSPFVNLFVRRRPRLVDEVVEAAAAMSKKKAGALVALERDASLWDYIKGGVRLEARVSSELLTSLFVPGSPMADGAAIIRDGKVAAAGCLLPPTDTPEVAKALGMRHRAAIGLTEETDAVAVVVSADEGAISAAVRGELMQGLSIEDLRGILTKLCSETVTEEPERGDEE
jgi:diadenylate cyclase